MATTKAKTPKQLTPREAGEELGIDQRAVRRAIRAGKLQATAGGSTGARWTIDAAEVKRFAAAETMKTSA